MTLPLDLIPLPTQPWDERPLSLPLDVEECRTALWMAVGNVTEAAQILKVSSSRLRNFIRCSPRLTEECREAREQLADTAESVVRDALTDKTDPGRRDQMARFVLNSQLGRQRGFGAGTPNIKINNTGPVIIGWADGTSFGGGEVQTQEPETIEGSALEMPEPRERSDDDG